MTLYHQFVRATIGAASALALAAGALAQSAAPPATATATATAILIENVRIFDGKSAKLSPPSNVLVLGNKIESISAAAIAAPAGATLTTIQGGGRTLMPGLIDNHVHVTLSANSLEDAVDPKVTLETINGRGLEEAKQMLMRGFTSVRDMGGPVFDLKRAIDQGKAPGPRVYPSGAMISQTSGHGDFRAPSELSRRFGGTASRGELLNASYIADGRDEVLTATRENLRGGASQIKVMAGGGAASAYDPLDVAQYTLDEIKAAVEAAADWGTYVTVHAYTPKAVRRAVQAGVKCIEHGQLLDEATVKLLAKEGIWLSLQVLDPAPPNAPQAVQIKKGQVVDGTDNAYRWAKKYKAKLAWGTDFLFNPAQNKNQSADILKLKKWFTPAEVLKMVTHDNAQLLALSGLRNPYPGKLGVVEDGALADLLLVNGDPIANIDLIADPEKNLLVVMKDGQLYKNLVQ
jgi:imidazolonepropionase-like amidohydrolase